MMKEAVVALIIKDGLILAISRRHNRSKFGLIGGKVDSDESREQALIREVKEETGLEIDQVHYHGLVNSINVDKLSLHCNLYNFTGKTKSGSSTYGTRKMF
jgi:8-oxo-dGTP pyrophosphatase MutT (NUDIX family)